MKKWTVGEYEDDADMGFIGQEGGSICWIDDILLYKATIIAERHNAELARVTEERDALEKMLEKAAEKAYKRVYQPWRSEPDRQEFIKDWLAALRPSK